jgi:hypothetical protein
VDPTPGTDPPPPQLGRGRWWARLIDPTRYLRDLRGVRPHLVKLNRYGESVVGVCTAIGVAILLQYSLPRRVTHYQRWVFPIVAILLIIGLVTTLGLHGKRRIDHESPVTRGVLFLTVVVMSIANGIAGYRLVRDLIEGEGARSAETLLRAGGAIWLTNIIVFALVYWLFDRGGPAARFLVKDSRPDLLFPQQMRAEEADWQPVFFDYVYTSFTAATAFSPTDVMPLSRWAKLAMMVESSLSLVLAILVIARAVNIL